MEIRPGTSSDQDAVDRLYSHGFGEEESEDVATLARELIEESRDGSTFTLVAEDEGKLAGHVGFSPIQTPGGNQAGFILAPLVVDPEYQGKGIGTALVKAGLEKLSAGGVAYALVYGDPAYYGRFGFDADLGTFFRPPYPIEHPFGWQALALNGHEAPEETVPFRCVEPLDKAHLW